MTIHKILKYLAIVVGIVGLILLGRILYTGDEAIEGSADLQSSVVNPILFLAYFIFALILLLVLIFVVKGLFKGNIKNTLISIGAFGLIVLVAYLLADGSIPSGINEAEMPSESSARWISTGLITFYFLAVIAIAAMIFSGIKKLIK